MEVPQEGKYGCKLNDQMVIYEASTGSLCGAMPCVMIESGYTFKHTVVLVKADGTVQTKTIDTLKALYDWDGLDPFWLMDNSVDGGPMRSVEFEIVGGPETGDKGGVYFKSKWLNPLGGGMRTPVAADRRSVLARYGTKFQALAGVGGQSREQKAESRNAGVPPVPSGAARPATPPPGVVMATMEEAWAALNEAQTGKPAEAIEKVWFDTIARLFPNKSNTDLKPHEWGKLKAEFEDNIPM
jgi:hypothetical protein